MKLFEMQADGVTPTEPFPSGITIDNPSAPEQVEECVKMKRENTPLTPTEKADVTLVLADGSKYPCRMLLRASAGQWKMERLYYPRGTNAAASEWDKRYEHAEEDRKRYGKNIPAWILAMNPQPTPSAPPANTTTPAATPPQDPAKVTSRTPRKRKVKTPKPKPVCVTANQQPPWFKAAFALCVLIALLIAGVYIYDAHATNLPATSTDQKANGTKAWTITPMMDTSSGDNQAGNGDDADTDSSGDDSADHGTGNGTDSGKVSDGSSASNPGTAAPLPGATEAIRKDACTPATSRGYTPQGGLYIGFCRCDRSAVGTPQTPGTTKCSFLVANMSAEPQDFTIPGPTLVTDDLGNQYHPWYGDVECGGAPDMQLMPSTPEHPAFVACTLMFRDASGGANKFANVTLTITWRGGTGSFPTFYQIPIH